MDQPKGNLLVKYGSHFLFKLSKTILVFHVKGGHILNVGADTRGMRHGLVHIFHFNERLSCKKSILAS
jgi:hypothetical protein